jgi:hypothetical protein
VSLIEVGVKREVWTKDPQICLSYRRQSLTRRIKSDVYLRKRVIHVFQLPLKNLKDHLLMVDPGNSSNIDFVNSQRNDYSWHTNLPFVYQITSSKYHEPIKD